MIPAKENKNIVIILPDVWGGVSSVIRNYLKFKTNEATVKYTVIQISGINNQFRFTDTFGADFQYKFGYNTFENQYKVLKRLSKFIPNGNTLIIANDGLELEMVNTLRLNVKVIFIIHGDFEYYYNLAVKFEGVINKFVTVSQQLKDTLLDKLPQRKDDIYYLPFTVENPQIKNEFLNSTLNLLFVGYINENKGIRDLPIIDHNLKHKRIIVNWTIVGDGELFNEMISTWGKESNVIFMGKLKSADVLAGYKNHDILIFPSRSEGFGMVVIEAMKAGICPVVNDLPTGVSEIIVNNYNGFRLPIGDIEAYTETIEYLHINRDKLRELSNNAYQSAITRFDATDSANKYEELFIDVLDNDKRNKSFFDSRLSGRLDSRYIPNLVTLIIRRIRSFIKH